MSDFNHFFHNMSKEFLLSEVGRARMEIGDNFCALPINSSILNMHGWNVTAITESEEDESYEVEAEYPLLSSKCPYCQSELLYAHGTKEARFVDLPVHNKRVFIKVQRKRFKCRNCGKTFQQPLPHMDEHHYMTLRLVAYIEEASLRRTFTSIAEQVGVSEKTIRLIFEYYADVLEALRELSAPRTLGIDEVFLIKQSRCVLVDMDGRKPIDLLIDRKKTTVTRWLMELPERDEVQVAVMDMWNPYRDAVSQVLPNAQIVVDKFHVVRMANDAMETIRKGVRSRLGTKASRQLKSDRFILLRRRDQLNDQQRLILDTWIQNFEELGNAYVAKEMFCDIWEADNREWAEAYYQRWLKYVDENGVRDAYSDLIRAVTNWHDEIFNHFDHHLTNAYTEAFNGILKLVNKNGRGYSFKTIRAKMLYGSQKPEPKQYTDLGF